MSYDSKHRLKPQGSKSGNSKESQAGEGRKGLFLAAIEDFRAGRESTIV